MTGRLRDIDLTISEIEAARPVDDLFLPDPGFISKGHREDWPAMDWAMGAIRS